MSRNGPRSSRASRTVLSKAPRMLEVIGPEGEMFLEAGLTISGQNCLERADISKEPNKYYGKLEVLNSNEEVIIEPVEAMSRKKISSKSNENKDLLTNSDNKLWSSFLQENTDKTPMSASTAMERTSQDALSCHSHEDTSKDKTVAKNNGDTSPIPDKRLSETTEDDEKHDDSCVGENVAPLELMTEFLRAVMSRNYTVAKKLCQLILLYEPENPEAKQFSSLIEEKLLMEKTKAGEEEAEEEEEEEDEEDDDSEDSSDDSEEDSSDDNNRSEDHSDESEDV
ncbi:glutamate-rich protein 2 [Macrotis lagotis]|uniref:glutamate-rich protein 2 n=1 Tax=Macrotis lagotis TaxID=92651 RepID=UPI003D6865E7